MEKLTNPDDIKFFESLNFSKLFLDFALYTKLMQPQNLNNGAPGSEELIELFALAEKMREIDKNVLLILDPAHIYMEYLTAELG